MTACEFAGRRPRGTTPSETEVADRLAIADVLSSYCFFMDDADYAGVAGLFDDEGHWQASYEEAHGRAEIEETLTRINPDPVNGPRRKHVILNSLVDIDEDTATARTSYLVFLATPTGPTPIIVGMYLDHLRRDSGDPRTWRFSSRRLQHEMTGADLALRLDR